MRIAKDDVPVKITAPGAVARLQPGFGDATRYGMMSAEYFSLAAGTDITPLLQGLDGNLCHAPHWGYVANGALTVTYRDGSSERVGSGDFFYWPPGHTVRIDEDADLLMFSPEHEHTQVLDHMQAKIAAAG
jgi:mannose-6-phosphate isomerase-like protein (cupin superfamily)